MIYSSDGFLLTFEAALGKHPQIVLPGGTYTPIRVASEPASGLLLLKVATSGLAPAQMTTATTNPGDKVFVAGFDQTTSPGQIAGTVRRPDSASPSTSPPLIRTDISAAEGFSGGALANDAGKVVGLVESERQGSATSVAAIPIAYVNNWINSWRQQNEAALGDTRSWPELAAGSDVTLRYPAGWSIADQAHSGRSFHAEIAPSDPDVPAKLSISIQPSDFNGEPMAYAEREFGDEGDATIWGSVIYDQIPGVRVLVNQEGARVDVVYFFTRGLRIGINLTAGYSIDNTSPQEQRITALFDGVLRSITLVAPTSTPTG